MSDWRNKKRLRKETSVVTMSEWRNDERLNKWNISGIAE